MEIHRPPSQPLNRCWKGDGHLTKDQLVSAKPIAIPENEAQARPLLKLNPEQQVKAAQAVAKKPGKHTAKDFEDAAEKVTGKILEPTKPSNEQDTSGVQSYDPREDKISAGRNSAKTDNSCLEKLMELVDQAQTQARKIVNGSDVVKMLNYVAKLITRKLNGGGK